MVLRSPCGTPLANNAGSTLIHTPTPSSTLMGVAAQHSSKSLAMASRMSTTGGLSKTLNCKSLIQNKFCPVCLFVLLLLLTAVSVSPISFQRCTFSWFPAKTRAQWWHHSDCSWSDRQSFKQVLFLLSISFYKGKGKICVWTYMYLGELLRFCSMKWPREKVLLISPLPHVRSALHRSSAVH